MSTAAARRGDVSIDVAVGEDALRLLEDPEWDRLPAAAGSVFHRGRFLQAWAAHRWSNEPPGQQLVAVRASDDADVFGQCVFELTDRVLSFAGGTEVVDYMGPVASVGREAEVGAAIADVILTRLDWHTAQLLGLSAGSLAATCLADELHLLTGVPIEVQDTTPRIAGGAPPYLTRLNAKRRADLLRKRHLLEQAVGPVEMVESTADSWLPSLDRLLVWKQQAGADTRAFVGEYASFLRGMLGNLIPLGAAGIVELRAADRPLAAAIVLRHGGTRLLYNMSYDQQVIASVSGGLAPGVVLVAALAERTVDAGGDFDFLKGAQDYKRRLGGLPVDVLTLQIGR